MACGHAYCVCRLSVSLSLAPLCSRVPRPRVQPPSRSLPLPVCPQADHAQDGQPHGVHLRASVARGVSGQTGKPVCSQPRTPSSLFPGSHRPPSSPPRPLPPSSVGTWATRGGGCQSRGGEKATHTTPPRTAVTAIAKLALVVRLHAQRRGAGSTRGRRLLGAARAGGGGTAGDAPALGPPGRSGHDLDACARRRRHGREKTCEGKRVSESALCAQIVRQRGALFCSQIERLPWSLAPCVRRAASWCAARPQEPALSRCGDSSVAVLHLAAHHVAAPRAPAGHRGQGHGTSVRAGRVANSPKCVAAGRPAPPWFLDGPLRPSPGLPVLTSRCFCYCPPHTRPCEGLRHFVSGEWTRAGEGILSWEHSCFPTPRAASMR